MKGCEAAQILFVDIVIDGQPSLDDVPPSFLDSGVNRTRKPATLHNHKEQTNSGQRSSHSQVFNGSLLEELLSLAPAHLRPQGNSTRNPLHDSELTPRQFNKSIPIIILIEPGNRRAKNHQAFRRLLVMLKNRSWAGRAAAGLNFPAAAVVLVKYLHRSC